MKLNAKILTGLIIVLIVLMQGTWVYAESWEVILWSPSTISFSGIIASQTDQDIFFYTSWTWNMFWVEDLKSSSSGYHVTLSAEDMIDENNSWNIISKSFIDAKIESGITTIYWWPSTWVTIPTSSSSWFTCIWDSIITIIERNTDVSPITWKYAIAPYFKIRVPAYQSIWSYKWVITYTLIEH